MSEPFLILHKVRGEPTFDIAEQAMIGDEEGWIVSTSGHRAYPFYAFHLRDFLSVPGAEVLRNSLSAADSPSWLTWPDHYSCNSSPIKQDLYEVKAKAKGLLEQLGLVKKVTVERRF